MPFILAAAALAGMAISTYETIDAANQQADAKKRDAKLKGAQADELLSRERINEGIIEEKNALQESEYKAEAASTGLEGGGIGGALRIRKQNWQNIANMQNDARYRANILRQGGAIDQQAAKSILTGGYISAAGGALSGAGKSYQAFSPPEAAQAHTTNNYTLSQQGEMGSTDLPSQGNIG